MSEICDASVVFRSLQSLAFAVFRFSCINLMSNNLIIHLPLGKYMRHRNDEEFKDEGISGYWLRPRHGFRNRRGVCKEGFQSRLAALSFTAVGIEMTAAVDAAVVFNVEINIDYRKVGPSGTIVTAYCLGTMKALNRSVDEA